MQETEDAKGTLRGTVSLVHPLSEAVSFLERAQAALGDGPFERGSLVQALGHQSASGPALVKIGALTHFGLAQVRDSSYALSELGRRILFPRNEDEKRVALAESACCPRLY